MSLALEIARKELQLAGRVPPCKPHQHEYRRKQKSGATEYTCTRHHYIRQGDCNCGRNFEDPKNPRLDRERMFQLKRITGTTAPEEEKP